MNHGKSASDSDITQVKKLSFSSGLFFGCSVGGLR